MRGGVVDAQKLALLNPDPLKIIRPVRLGDVETLRANFWPERSLNSMREFVNRACKMGEQGRGLGVVLIEPTHNHLLGYGQLTMWPQAAEISDLFIIDAYRGQGYGTTIIQYLVRCAREMQAPAVEIGAAYSNPQAMTLYRRLGFEDHHTVKVDLGSGPEVVLYLRITLQT